MSRAFLVILLSLAGCEAPSAEGVTIDPPPPVRSKNDDWRTGLPPLPDSPCVGDHVFHDRAGLASVDGCVIHDGALSIVGAHDVTDLAPLSKLERVRGTLEIRDTPHLDGLAHLARLVKVDGDLVIQRNERLERLDGLGRLEVVLGVVHVSRGESLSELALGRLERAGGLLVEHMPALEHLSLPRLRDVSLFVVQDAPRLPTCEAEGLVAQLGGRAAQLDLSISGTDDSAACP